MILNYIFIPYTKIQDMHFPKHIQSLEQPQRIQVQGSYPSKLNNGNQLNSRIVYHSSICYQTEKHKWAFQYPP
jgi:hypothetical protein